MQRHRLTEAQQATVTLCEADLRQAKLAVAALDAKFKAGKGYGTDSNWAGFLHQRLAAKEWLRRSTKQLKAAT
jgi:hypothetical protein